MSETHIQSTSVVKEGASAEKEQNAFEEERMSRANDNLRQLSADSDSVVDIAKLWQDSYDMAQKPKKDDDQEKSSLFIFPNSP
jgi:hypothetical protein